MAIVVPNSNKSLELGPLTSSVCFCLLEPHHLGIHPGKINNLGCFRGHGEEADLPQGLDVHVLDQALAQPGDRDPLLVFGFTSVSPASSASTSTTTTAESS